MDSMTLTEGSIRAASVDMVSTHHFRIMTVTAAIGYCLTLEVFSFVVRVVNQAIETIESVAADRDLDLGFEIDTATGLTTNNRSYMGSAEPDDAIRDASTVCVKENRLLTDQLADHQLLLIDMPSGA
jgi:hypothetical protein